jgi:hypothetical protein
MGNMVSDLFHEMTKITNSYQSHKSYRKYKSENGRTRTSEYIRVGIRYHGGVSIPCSYQSLGLSWHTDLDYGSYCLPNLEVRLKASMTCRQSNAYSSYAPDLTSSVSKGQCKPDIYCTIDCSNYWTWPLIWTANFFPFTRHGALILTAGCSVYLVWTHWFCIWNEAHGRCDRSTGFSPLWHLIPTLIHVYSEVRVCPFSDFLHYL